MDIDKIRESMKVLKDECKKYRSCEDCIFHNNEPSCYLQKAPDKWDEEKIIENNCTTVTMDADEWYCGLVLKCDNCDEEFILNGSEREHIVGKFCPHCGKKIVNYKEEKE